MLHVRAINQNTMLLSYSKHSLESTSLVCAGHLPWSSERIKCLVSSTVRCVEFPLTYYIIICMLGIDLFVKAGPGLLSYPDSDLGDSPFHLTRCL